MEIETFLKLAKSSPEEFEKQTFNMNVLDKINHEKFNGISFLYYIVKNNNIPLIKHILEKYENKIILDHLTPANENVLHVVSSVEMFDLLTMTSLKNNLYEVDNKGNSLLHKYISNWPLINKIKPYFENYNIVNKNNQSALAFLILPKKVEDFIKVYELFDGKMNLYIKNNKGVFLPFALFEKYNEKDIEKLLELNIDFSKTDENKNTLFHFVAKSGALSHKLYVFDKNKSIYYKINDKNNENETAANLCLIKNNHMGLEKFVANGLELNAKEIENILTMKDQQYKYLFREIFFKYFNQSNLVFDTIIQGNVLSALEELAQDQAKKNYTYNYIAQNFLDRMQVFNTYYEKVALESSLETQKNQNQKRKMKI